MMIERPPAGHRESFHLGGPDRPLFACFHTPEAMHRKELAVVLCNPFGPEYMRSHRAILNLALHLAAAGYPVLRFDFFGTGDSAGAEEEATVSGWMEDISQAVLEIRRRTRCRQVALVGLRFGATLAVLAAAQQGDISAVGLWDPIVDGQEYLGHLLAQQQEVLWRFFDRPVATKADEGSTELLGMQLSPDLLRDIAALSLMDLLELTDAPARHALIVESKEAPTVQALRGRLAEHGVDVTYQFVPGFSIWTEDVDKGLVPTAAIQSIGEWLSGLES